MSEMSQDHYVLFRQFIDQYYPSIYSAILRLTGLTDEKELETITVDVFDELWNNRDQLLHDTRPPAFIYRILVRHVFAYLRKLGFEDRIMALQNTLLIDPSYYETGLPPGEGRPGVDP